MGRGKGRDIFLHATWGAEHSASSSTSSSLLSVVFGA